MQLEINKNQHTTMVKYIQFLGLAMIIIPAIIVVTGSFIGWQDNNAINLSMLATIIAGIVVYVFASKQSLAAKYSEEEGKVEETDTEDDGATKIVG